MQRSGLAEQYNATLCTLLLDWPEDQDLPSIAVHSHTLKKCSSISRNVYTELYLADV